MVKDHYFPNTDIMHIKETIESRGKSPDEGTVTIQKVPALVGSIKILKQIKK